jgi:hypothetical protein
MVASVPLIAPKFKISALAAVNIPVTFRFAVLTESASISPPPVTFKLAIVPTPLTFKLAIVPTPLTFKLVPVPQVLT